MTKSRDVGPSGIGWWVAYERAIDPGPKALDLALAVEHVRSTGAAWVALRAGAGGAADPDLTEVSVQAFRNAGIGVAVWIFDYVPTQASELRTLARFYRAGVRWAILNAEFEYLPAKPSQALDLVRSARSIGFEWVAHAPPDYVGGRGEGALATLDVECDAILPQCYAWEHNDKGHAYHLDHVGALYSARGLIDKTWPVLCSYRPRTRGYDAAGKGIPTPHMDNEGERVAADLVAALSHPWVRSATAPSIYTIEAAAPEVWVALAAHAPTDPAPPHTDEPMGGGTPDAGASPLRDEWDRR